MAKPFRWSVALGALPLEALESSLSEAKAAGATEIFVEIGDGRFAPGFGAGTDILSSLQRCSELPVHLNVNVSDPDAVLNDLLELGCRSITFPVETLRHGHRVLSQLREYRIRPGASILPATSLAALHYLEPLLDQAILQMREPGLVDTELRPVAFDRIRIFREHLEHRRYKTEIVCHADREPAVVAAQLQAGARRVIVSDPEWVNGAPIAETIDKLIDGIKTEGPVA